MSKPNNFLARFEAQCPDARLSAMERDVLTRLFMDCQQETMDHAILKLQHNGGMS